MTRLQHYSQLWWSRDSNTVTMYSWDYQIQHVLNSAACLAGVWPSAAWPCHRSTDEPALTAGPRMHRVKTLCPGVHVTQQYCTIVHYWHVTTSSDASVTNHSTICYRLQCCSVPSVNSLSIDIRNAATLYTFKKKLKTFIFYKHFIFRLGPLIYCYLSFVLTVSSWSAF